MRRLDISLQRARIKRAVKHIGRGSRVLDIGCHHGELAGFLSAGDCRYYGLDPEVAEPTENLARGRFPEQLPAEWLAVPFDHAVALAVLEHLSLDQLADFLSSLRTSLRPGGTLIATVPSPATDRVLAMLHRVRLIDGMDLEAHDGLTVSQLLDTARQAGLRLDRHERFQFGFNNLFVWTRP
jgi:cyclopropane fatty-acyl-phospholipid synthase-like methyltransferase